MIAIIHYLDRWQQLTPTSYTDKVLVTDEVAEFSPAIIEEMRMHVAKYPADRTRSALIPLLFVVQRERRLDRQSGRQFSGEVFESGGDGRLGDGDVLLDVQSASRRPASHPDLQDAVVQDHGRARDHRAVCSKLGIHPGETTDDGKFTVTMVECLEAAARHR